MGRLSGAALRRVWEGRFRRFACGGLTVAAFCEQEGVSTPSFYQWRRRLRESEQQAPGVTAKRRQPRPRTPQVFVPVRVAPAASAVQMRLPNGVELAVPAGDTAILAAAIAAAGRIAAPSEEVGPC
jgi:transposase-like protein